jgi:glycosyltransferase involved in cell wall biosynthesis
MLNCPTARIEGGRRLREGPRKTPALVSIVTVVFRARQELRRLLDSICALQDERLELIVIDGGSDDGTVELLRHLDRAIDYWMSEPDGGIYDAMNKGIAAASGDYVLHLNAGDRLRHIPYDALQESSEDGIDVACFCVNMTGWGVFRPRAGWLLRMDNTLHHQGTFYRRKDHLGYDTRYRVFADFDYNQKLLKASRSFRLFNEVVADQAELGVSASRDVRREFYRIIGANFGMFYVALAFVWDRFAGLRRRLKHGLTFLEDRLRNPSR